MEIKILTNSTTPAAPSVISALIANSSAPVKSVLGEMTRNRLPVYIDSVADTNLYGYLKPEEVFPSFSEESYNELLEEGNYTITLTGTSGKYILGVFEITESAPNSKSSINAELKSQIKKLADAAVNAGFRDEEDMEKVLKYMEENNVDPYLQIDVVSGYRKYSKSICKPYCLYKDPALKPKEESIISKGLRAAVNGHAVILEGDKSVGKNVYADTILWLLGKPKYLITFSRQMSPSSIYGEKTTDNSAAQALSVLNPEIIELAEKAEFAQRIFIQTGMSLGHKGKALEDYIDSMMPEEWKKALAEKALFEKRKAQASSVNIIIDQSELYDWLIDGGGMIFNEMNLAEANFFASFTNQLLDGTGFIFIPGRGEVSIHPDCTLIGTQNANYQGCEMQNEATMSRFECIDFPQPKDIEGQLKVATQAAIKLGKHPEATLDDSYYKACQNFYKQCSRAVKQEIVTNSCLNIRGFVRACKQVAESHGYTTLKTQLELHVINTCPTDDRAALKASLEQIINL